MIKIRNLFMMMVVWCFASVIYAETPVTTNIIQQSIADYMSKHATPGVAVLLYVDGQPQSYYFGYADAAKKTPVTEQTIFEVGSISKVMTSILLAENIDLAKTQLDVPVRKYLPVLSDDFNDITLQNLATHTSGLPVKVPDTIKTKMELDHYLATFYPDYIANEQWIYSNVGMGLLGEALEKLTHKNLNVLLRTQLLAPLGMQAIGLEVPKTLQAHVAQGYGEEGQPVPLEQIKFFSAGYGVKASVSDMRLFLGATIGLPKTPEQLFYPIRMTQASYAQVGGFAQGLGWQIYSLKGDKAVTLVPAPASFDLGPLPITDIKQPTFDGNNLIDKTGLTDGFRAYIAVIPNKKTGIVILANKTDASGDIVTVGRTILFTLNNINMTPAAPTAAN